MQKSRPAAPSGPIKFKILVVAFAWKLDVVTSGLEPKGAVRKNKNSCKPIIKRLLATLGFSQTFKILVFWIVNILHSLTPSADILYVDILAWTYFKFDNLAQENKDKQYSSVKFYIVFRKSVPVQPAEEKVKAIHICRHLLINFTHTVL